MEREHNFVVKTQKNLPLIKADASRLQEAMENLISNAIKYSPDGGDITIRVRGVSRDEISPEFRSDTTHGNFLLVSISDQGIGIPPEKKICYSADLRAFTIPVVLRVPG